MQKTDLKRKKLFKKGPFRLGPSFSQPNPAPKFRGKNFFRQVLFCLRSSFSKPIRARKFGTKTGQIPAIYFRILNLAVAKFSSSPKLPRGRYSHGEFSSYLFIKPSHSPVFRLSSSIFSAPIWTNFFAPARPYQWIAQIFMFKINLTGKILPARIFKIFIKNSFIAHAAGVFEIIQHN